VKRIKNKIVEPADIPSDEQQAIDIYRKAGWPSEDTRWLAALSLAILPHEPPSHAELDELARINLKTLARSWENADRVRDRALVMVFVRLCDCGGKNGTLGKKTPSHDGFSPPQERWSLPDSQRADVAERFREYGADFEGAIRTGVWPGDYGTGSEIKGILAEYARHGPHHDSGTPEIVRLMQALVDNAGLDLSKVIDKGPLVDASSHHMKEDDPEASHLRVPKPIDRSSGPSTDARSLSTWMIGSGPGIIQQFFPVFKQRKNDRYAAAMAFAVRDAIEEWLTVRHGHWTYFDQGGAELAEACKPYLDELEQRCTERPREIDPAVRHVWLWFAWCVYEADPSSWRNLPPTRREIVLRAANEDIAALRKLLSRAFPKPLVVQADRDRSIQYSVQTGNPPLAPLTDAERCQGWGHLIPENIEGPIEEKERAPWEEFEWKKDHFQTCVMLLFQLGGVWKGLKPMLLAWRALSTRAVAYDLRYWSERDRVDPPQPWSDLVTWPINLFHVYVGREQATDPELVELRGDFSQFCLERLVDRWGRKEREAAERAGRQRTDDDMVERSPEWRLCYIRAVVSLGINPEGKGHRTLHASSRLDPCEDVREAARQAYERLRRGGTLPENVSPRRAIMSALWWCRQAHLLGLGIQPDPDGAQRTRVKELTRTKEAERADNPAI